MTFFDKPKVAGIDEYELRWALENVLRVRFVHEVAPGPAGQALVWEFLAGHGRRLFREAVLSMRSAGLGWREIADQLGRLEPGEEYESAVRMFEAVAVSEDSWGNRCVRWHCDTCSGWVHEYGPEGESHPVDAEPGHKDDCERLAAAVARYQAEAW